MDASKDFRVLPFAARCTVILFAVGGLAAVLSASMFQRDVASGRLLLLLTVAAVAGRAKVKLLKGATLSFLTFVVFLAIITEGLAVAVLVGLCGVTVQTLLPSKKLVLHQLAFNAGMIALTVSASWWTYHLLAAQKIDAISTELIAMSIASFTYFLGNSLSVSLIVALSKGISAFHVWYHHFLFSAPSFLIAGLLALGTFAVGSSQRVFIPIVLLNVILIAYYCSVRVTGLAMRHDGQTAAR
jgi:hypothetical protein